MPAASSAPSVVIVIAGPSGGISLRTVRVFLHAPQFLQHPKADIATALCEINERNEEKMGDEPPE